MSKQKEDKEQEEMAEGKQDEDKKEVVVKMEPEVPSSCFT